MQEEKGEEKGEEKKEGERKEEERRRTDLPPESGGSNPQLQ